MFWPCTLLWLPPPQTKKNSYPIQPPTPKHSGSSTQFGSSLEIMRKLQQLLTMPTDGRANSVNILFPCHQPHWRRHGSIFIKSIILAEMKWPFHFGQNEMKYISFWPKWDVHFGQNEMGFISFRSEWNGHLISARMKWSFHFGRNEMTISFWSKWNKVHFILAEMRCPFWP